MKNTIFIVVLVTFFGVEGMSHGSPQNGDASRKRGRPRKGVVVVPAPKKNRAKQRKPSALPMHEEIPVTPEDVCFVFQRPLMKIVRGQGEHITAVCAKPNLRSSREYPVIPAADRETLRDFLKKYQHAYHLTLFYCPSCDHVARNFTPHFEMHVWRHIRPFVCGGCGQSTYGGYGHHSYSLRQGALQEYFAHNPVIVARVLGQEMPIESEQPICEEPLPNAYMQSTEEISESGQIPQGPFTMRDIEGNVPVPAEVAEVLCRIEGDRGNETDSDF